MRRRRAGLVEVLLTPAEWAAVKRARAVSNGGPVTTSQEGLEFPPELGEVADDAGTLAVGWDEQAFALGLPVEMCFDTIRANALHIPRNAFAVAGYVNGAVTDYIWTPREWGLFPQAGKIRINVTGAGDKGNMLDVERFDATPADVAPWWDARHRAGERTLIAYCNRSNLAAVNNALGRRPCWRCVATLDGTMTFDARAMVQFSDARRAGGPYDVSVIWSPNLAAAIAAMK